MVEKTFSTVACLQASIEEILEASKIYGMDSVEIRLGTDNSVVGIKGKEAIQEESGELFIAFDMFYVAKHRSQILKRNTLKDKETAIQLSSIYII